jgi:hypothetical protein
MAKKSIVEEALLEAKQLEEALKRNSKEILAATMKQDIDEMVKASLQEGDEMADEDEGLEDESQMESSEDESSTMVTDESTEDESTEDESTEDESTEDETADESLEMDELVMNSDEQEEESEEGESEEGEGSEENNMDMDFSSEEPTDDTEIVDMTSASDHELITVFKKMSDDDEIEVVKTGNNVNLKDKSTGAEYVIKMDESMSYDDEDETMSYDEMVEDMEDEDEGMSFDEMMKHLKGEDESSCDECGWEESSEDEGETMYEISFDDDDDDESDDEILQDIPKMPKPKHVGDFEDSEEIENSDDEEEYEDSDESWGASDEGSRRTLHDRRAKQIHPQNYPMDESVKSEYKKIIKEYEDLKDKYSQTKDALKVFRDKLSEIALFNSNLTHAVKLFMEHATTKQEKLDIMKRFDEEAVSLKESKRLYKTMTNELKGRKPISEKVEKKINESLTKGSSDTLIESKVYVDPQISKIHELMDKLERK